VGIRCGNNKRVASELVRLSTSTFRQAPAKVADELQQRLVKTDGRPVDQARVALVAAAGGKRSDAAAVRGDGATDYQPTIAT
jgi:hypothetical protein